jgi:hypothetical protein
LQVLAVKIKEFRDNSLKTKKIYYIGCSCCWCRYKGDYYFLTAFPGIFPRVVAPPKYAMAEGAQLDGAPIRSHEMIPPGGHEIVHEIL